MMIESNVVFRLKKYQVLPLYRKLFRFAKKAIKSNYGLDVDFYFNDNIGFGDGDIQDCCVDNLTKPIIVNIGIKGLFDDCNSLFDDVSDFRFVCPIVAVFHETEHACQLSRRNVSAGVNDEDVVLGISALARIGNNVYYKSNYHMDLREIRAQQVGILDSYSYLCGLFSNVDDCDIERVLLDYVNCSSGPECFVDNHGVLFQSLDDVDAAFDVAFNSSMVTKRRYEINVCDNVMDIMRKVDTYQFVIDYFNDCNNAGYKQDEMIACLNAYLHPKLLDSFSCFKAKSVDLSVNTIFGMPFPDNKVAGAVVHGIENAQVSKSSKMVLNRVRGDVSGSRPLPSFSEHMSDDGDYGNSGPNS